MRTNLQFCGQDICTVVITSCNENEGKTTTTLQLAKSLAELDKRVLVIDADMRKSVMAGRNTTAENPCGTERGADRTDIRQRMSLSDAV